MLEADLIVMGAYYGHSRLFEHALGGTGRRRGRLGDLPCACGDAPDPRLIGFYRGFRACVRARRSACRLDDAPADRRDEWLARIDAYLGLAVDARPLKAV